MPFSCMTFRELLRTVTQATENKNFEPEYLAIVARYFSDFAEITERDGYNVENNVSSSYPQSLSHTLCIYMIECVSVSD